MSSFTALLDACVLYPAPLRDTLLHIAVRDLYRARWTDEIHEEWIRALLQQRPDLTESQLRQTQALMNLHVRDCLVTGYEPLVGGLKLPDPGDRHVLAAAIRCGANVIVTFNLCDFPQAYLRAFGIEAVHPDEFLLGQLQLSAATVCAAMKAQRQNLRNPARSPDQLLETLHRMGLPKFVSELGNFRELI